MGRAGGCGGRGVRAETLGVEFLFAEEGEAFDFLFFFSLLELVTDGSEEGL